MKDAQILDGRCQRVAQDLSKTQFNISHVKKKKKEGLGWTTAWREDEVLGFTLVPLKSFMEALKVATDTDL